MDYFTELNAGELTEQQHTMLAAVHACLDRLHLEYLEAFGATSAVDDKRRLVLTLIHANNPSVTVRIRISPDGRTGVLCAALHPDFSFCFNDLDEPFECLGNTVDGIRALTALLEGRVESRIVWGGDHIAKTVDTLIHDDGSRERLSSEYKEAGLFGAIFSRRRETRRVSFRDVAGLI
jgi:hypothetical protein